MIGLEADLEQRRECAHGAIRGGTSAATTRSRRLPMTNIDRMPRAALAALATVLAASCAEPNYDTGLDPDRDVRDDVRLPTRTPASAPANEPDPADVEVVPSPPTSPPGTLAKCVELVVRAWSCASFEAGGASAAWSAKSEGGGSLRTKARPNGEPGFALESFFPTIPTAGRATLGIVIPGGATSVALRFWFRAPRDGYPSRLALGGLVDATGRGTVIAMRDGQRLVVEDDRADTGTKTASLGAVVHDRWTCVELELASSGTIKAHLDGSAVPVFSIDAARFAQTTRAEIGLTYRGGANTNASTILAFDDVVVGPTAVGCR
jgi:hypothetical protein